jgi:hypothetical protein
MMKKNLLMTIALLCAVAQGLVLTACSANEDAPVVDPQPLSPLEEALEDGSTIEFDIKVGDKPFNPKFLRENDAFTHLNPMSGEFSTLMYNRVKNEMTLSYKRTDQQTRAEVDKPMPGFEINFYLDDNLIELDTTAVLEESLSFQSITVNGGWSSGSDFFSDAMLIEDFESGSIPRSWGVTKGQGTWSVGKGDDESFRAFEGEFNAKMTHVSNDGYYDVRLITPIIDLEGRTGTHVTFWYLNRKKGKKTDYLRLYYRSDPNSNWVLLKEIKDAHEFWTCEDIDLPNPSAHYQIVFEGADNRGHGIGLDKIRVSADFDGFWGIPLY